MVWDSSAGLKAPIADFEPLASSSEKVAVEGLKAGEQIWLVQVPAEFNVHSLNGKQLKFPSEAASSAKAVELSDGSGMPWELRAGAPAIASQFKVLFPSRSQEEGKGTVFGPKVDRLFTVTSTGGAQAQHSDDEDEDEVEGGSRVLGKPMTPAALKPLSRPTGLAVRFWPSGSKPNTPTPSAVASAATVSASAAIVAAATKSKSPKSKSVVVAATKSKSPKSKSVVSTPTPSSRSSTSTPKSAESATTNKSDKKKKKKKRPTPSTPTPSSTSSATKSDKKNKRQKTA